MYFARLVLQALHAVARALTESTAFTSFPSSVSARSVARKVLPASAWAAVATPLLGRLDPDVELRPDVDPQANPW